MRAKIHCGLTVLSMFLMRPLLGCGIAGVQKAVAPTEGDLDEMARLGVGLGDQKCNAVQSQIDGIKAVYESNLSDEEKMAKLSAIWSNTAADLKKSFASDQDVKAAVEPYLLMLEGACGQCADLGSGRAKATSPRDKRTFDRMKVMTSSYVKMMRLLCPKLTLPPIVGK